MSTRARDLEASGELNMALAHWQLVQRIANDPSDANREIGRLEKKIAAAVQSHYLEGLEDLNQNKLTTARNHFLAALRLDPRFQPALKQINARFSAFPLRVYLSVAGDQPATVAEKVFGDEKKAFLVAWFNDLHPTDVLTPGSILILPKLEKGAPQERLPKKAPNWLAKARERLSKNDFDGALVAASRGDTTNPDVQLLIHTIYLQKAHTQIEEGLLDEARQSLDLVPDGFAGKDSAAEKLGAGLAQRQLTLDLADARRKLEQEKYAQSLGVAEKLLEQVPENVTAADLVNEARFRLAQDHVDHGRYLEAREVLARADDGHEPSAALKQTVQLRLVKLGQVYYRSGVKHYINENLQQAIAEWEKALACNPDHAKARENIANARRLLKKVESLP
ncbi:MAG: hypothetical protein PVG51_01665 [Desulfosarcina sp.]